MKRAFSTLCCLEYDMAQIYALASACKMDAVELRVDDAKLLNFTDAKLWGAHFSENGIPICDVATSISVQSSDVGDLYKKYIDLAADLRSPAIRVFAGKTLRSLEEQGSCDTDGIAAGLKTICTYAAERGIEVWLETHSELSTGKACRQILDAAAMPNLKILWDVLHSLEFREDISTSLAYIGDALVHVHLKDAVPSADPTKYHYTHTDLGAGIFPFKHLLEELKKVGYAGYLSLEWESPWCPEIRHLYPDPRDLLKKYHSVLDAAE